ncbi:MAG TPA: hypothetical protein VIK18_22375 [Pirellulales bacterium]
MGILSRAQGDQYVITSDRSSDGSPSSRIQKRLSETYQVWTGDKWSTAMADAKTFKTMDDADEYVRANYAQVMAG